MSHNVFWHNQHQQGQQAADAKIVALGARVQALESMNPLLEERVRFLEGQVAKSDARIAALDAVPLPPAAYVANEKSRLAQNLLTAVQTDNVDEISRLVAAGISLRNLPGNSVTQHRLLSAVSPRLFAGAPNSKAASAAAREAYTAARLASGADDPFAFPPAARLASGAADPFAFPPAARLASGAADPFAFPPAAGKEAAAAAKEAAKAAETAAKTAAKEAAAAADPFAFPPAAAKEAAAAAKRAAVAAERAARVALAKAAPRPVPVEGVPVTGTLKLIDGRLYMVRNGNVYEYHELEESAGAFVGRLTGDETINRGAAEVVGGSRSRKTRGRKNKRSSSRRNHQRK